MSTSKRYIVRQNFETFGSPGDEEYSQRDQAEAAANALAESLAETFYTFDGDDALIPFYTRADKTGSAHEIAFHEGLSEQTGATESAPGRIPRAALVAAIRDGAVTIEEVEA